MCSFFKVLLMLVGFLSPDIVQDPGLSPTHCCETSQLLDHFPLFYSSGKQSTIVGARQACGAHVWEKKSLLSVLVIHMCCTYILCCPWHTHLSTAFDRLKMWAAEPVNDCRFGKWSRNATQTPPQQPQARWRHLGTKEWHTLLGYWLAN